MFKVLLTMLILMTPQLANADQVDQTNQALHKLIKDFEASIINKDTSKLMSLFIDNKVLMIGVQSQSEFKKALAWAQSEQGLALKKKLGNKFREPAKYRVKTPQQFIDLLKTNKPFKELISDIKINSNNEVATISFNYQFFDGDKLMNYGVENWQVINDGETWKISAVNFSVDRK